MYKESFGYSNPKIYLREIPGISIDETSIQVVKSNTHIPFTVTGYTTTQGEKILVIQPTTNI
jgi:hypothetical protein